jgi:lipid A 3-O-deacylase
MLIRIGIVFFLVLAWNRSISQEKKEGEYKHQLTFTLDNDVFAFKGTDRYYSNGLFFQYSILRKSKGKNVVKQIDEVELGQQIYNAFRRQINIVDEMDRPIAGYLYGKYSRATFTSKSQLYKYGLSVGTIGKASLSEEVLKVIHPLLKITNYWTWVYDYQLKDEVGVNVHGKYAFSTIKTSGTNIQISPETNFTIGTSFTNISQSLHFQYGKFNQMFESEFWRSRLGQGPANSRVKKEFFFFYEPEVVCQIYNATIQGGMFRRDKGPIVSPAKTFVLYNNLGVMYSKGNFSTSFQYVTQSREAKYQRDRHAYGSVKFSYCFK